MREYTQRGKTKKRLYLIEITHKDWEGSVIHRGYYAHTPRQAVEELVKCFTKEDGYTVAAMRFRILAP
jgi:hypothetical protein